MRIGKDLESELPAFFLQQCMLHNMQLCIGATAKLEPFLVALIWKLQIFVRLLNSRSHYHRAQRLHQGELRHHHRRKLRHLGPRDIPDIVAVEDGGQRRGGQQGLGGLRVVARQLLEARPALDGGRLPDVL